MTEDINEDHEMVLDPSLIESLDVEQPLEKPTGLGVLDKIMDKVYRVNNKVTDVLENLDKETKKGEFDNNALRRKFQNLFLPKEKMDQLIILTQDFKDGYYFYLKPVGLKEKNNKHLHTFIMKKEGDNLIFCFVDPEYRLGVSNKLRPSVCNLMSFSVSRNPVVEPELSILRLKTKKERPLSVLIPSVLDLNENNGLAHFMEEGDDSVTFRLNIRADNTIIESRYIGNTSGEQLIKLIPLHIRAKANSQRHLMNNIINGLRDSKFEEMPDSKKKMWRVED